MAGWVAEPKWNVTPSEVLPQQSKSLERIHLYFVGSLLCVGSFVKLALAKCHRFHIAVQVFESIRKLGPYLHNRFSNSYAFNRTL